MKKNRNIFALLIIFLNTNLIESEEINSGLKLFSNVENELMLNKDKNTSEENLNLEKINNEIKGKSKAKIKNFYFENFLKREDEKEKNKIEPNNVKEINPIISEEVKIKKSNKIKYPNTPVLSNIVQCEDKTISSEILKEDFEDTKMAGNTGDSEVYIAKSSKIYYPPSSELEKDGKSNKISLTNDSKFIYYVKVYPNYENDGFEPILNLNESFSTKREDSSILIGPIPKDNLGIMTQIIKVKGYNLVEYVKNKIKN